MGQVAKPLNLAARKKNLSLIDSVEKELGRIKLLFHIINVDFSLHGTAAVLATIQYKQFHCYQVYRIKIPNKGNDENLHTTLQFPSS